MNYVKYVKCVSLVFDGIVKIANSRDPCITRDSHDLRILLFSRSHVESRRFTLIHVDSREST